VPTHPEVPAENYKWAAPGDVNAFFGLMLDNIADLLLAVLLLSGVFNFPAEFALRYMVPGTAIGVLVGDLLFFWMALRLARRSGRNDITAMPLGLDTPSTFGMVFFVLGPAFVYAQGELGYDASAAAAYTWQIGICAIVTSGVFKLACAAGSNWVRRVVPRAGLLGSLAAIALVLISFLPLIEVLHFPIVGMVALAIILTTLVAQVRLPLKVPGAAGALIVAGTLYWTMYAFGWLHDGEPAQAIQADQGLLPTAWIEVFRFEWVGVFEDSLRYLPIVIPFALATVVGGIDCTESAAAAGDEFDTGQVIAVEAVATLAAGLCGGVIQTTPYIGHPAYKAMGGRAAYTLATALFVGSAGLIGYFGYLYMIIPKATVFPILIFIGLEITAQSYHATKRAHYPAVALACVPALASLLMIFLDRVIAAAGVNTASLPQDLQTQLLTLRILSSGFIVTSLLWAAMLAKIIDRRLITAAVYAGLAAICSLLGIIHSPLPGSPIKWPADVPAELAHVPWRYFLAYAAVAAILLLWAAWLRSRGEMGVPEDESIAAGVSEGPPADRD